ncbi:MAG TPA: hypothetical protein GXZ97_09135 [Hydrogenispora sp.]|jgi:hypothetical protein|nr:hypothetical protein [Hydrogenispora sp.]
MFYAEEYKEKNESFVSVNRFIQPRKANEVTSDETKRSLGKNSLSDARPLLVQLKNDHPTETAVKSDKLTTGEYTDAKNTTQAQSMDPFSKTRNEKVTVYLLTPDDGLQYINHILKSDIRLSKVGDILTYSDLLSSGLNITTLGFLGYISIFFDNELKLIKKAYDDLKSMYIAAWPATNMTWEQFCDHYRLEITYISYQERIPQDIGQQKYYVLQEFHKGRKREDIVKDFDYLYQWVDRSITLARFVNYKTGEYLMDAKARYIQTQLFKGPTLRKTLPVGREFLEQNAEVKPNF